MALGLKPRRAGEALDLESHRAGHALLVNVKGALDQQALAFARGLPADPEHNLVVLDLPADATDATWAELARMLRRRTGDYRLVLGRRLPGGVLPVGQWLADRLDRAVTVPDGTVVPAAGGVLYVPVDGGSGWVRLQPRRPATPVSRRFPKPIWEFSVADQPWNTSELAVADPLASGVWLRSAEQEPGTTGYRGRLQTRLAFQRELLTVVLGCPGARALPLDDVCRFWESVLPGARSLVRFVQYGPLAVPEEAAPGQALADRLDSPVVFYNGLPVGRAPWEEPEVHALDGDGTLGWAPFARELRYLPARMTGGRPTAPSVFSHRPVADDIPQVAPGVYQYADDALLEVVPSGLWMRTPDEPAGATLIRSAAADPRQFNLVFGTGAHTTGRMRDLAESLLSRLDPVIRGLARLVPAAHLLRGTRARVLPSATAPAALTPARPARPVGADASASAALSEHSASNRAPAARPDGGTPAPVTGPDTGAVHPAYMTAPVSPAPAPAVPGTAGPTSGPAALGGPSAGSPASRGQAWEHTAPGRSEAGEAAPDADVPQQRQSVSAGLPEEPSGTVGETPGAGADAEPPESAGAPPAPDDGPDPVTALEPDSGAPGVPASAPPMPTMPSLRLVSAPAPTAAAPVGSAAPPTGHAGAGAGRTPPSAPAPAEPEAAQAAGGGCTAEPRPGRPGHPRPQPVPSPAACALPPRKGIAREREWLRSAFRQQYNDGAGAVARVLSQSPGLRGTGQTSTEDVITDLVAARLYLRGEGELLDRAVRAATVGPHVPLARCVTAGLRRLPSYRGVTMLRATLDEAEWAWYAGRRLVTEWAFTWALTTAAPALPGNVDFLMWSTTARRTVLLEPDLPDRVLFLPGTSFKVLAVRDAERRTVLLRELPASEIGADGQVDVERTPLDEIALSGLDQADQAWRAVEPEAVRNVPDAATGRFGAPPGLILGPDPAAPDTPGAPGTIPRKRTTP